MLNVKVADDHKGGSPVCIMSYNALCIMHTEGTMHRKSYCNTQQSTG